MKGPKVLRPSPPPLLGCLVTLSVHRVPSRNNSLLRQYTATTASGGHLNRRAVGGFSGPLLAGKVKAIVNVCGHRTGECGIMLINSGGCYEESIDTVP